MSLSTIVTGLLVVLGLMLHCGCGNTISASPKAANAKNAAAPSSATASSPPASDAAAASKVVTTATTVDPPATLTPTAAFPDPSPASAAPVRSDLPRNEVSAAFVQPTTVALLSTEASAEPVKPQPPAAAPKKPTPKGADTGKAPDPNRTNNYSFDDLKFDIEKDAPFERSMLPKKIEDYAGHRVSIRGFILPTSFQTGLTNFVLVRDNMECCFGPGAALYDCIVIQMAEGKSTDYTIRPVTVEGKFSIDEFIGPGRRHLAIYKIVADKVE